MKFNYIKIFRLQQLICICRRNAGRAYIIGADPSTGSDGDYQALTVWDITNAFNIELVASFYENDVPPKVFAYIIAKVASIYNRGFVAIENNRCFYGNIRILMA